MAYKRFIWLQRVVCFIKRRHVYICDKEIGILWLGLDGLASILCPTCYYCNKKKPHPFDSIKDE